MQTKMSLKQFSDHALLERTKHLAAEERRITAELMEVLREVEARRLYAREGYGSLFEYLHKGLGFSEGSAVRRVNAMRLTKTLPQVQNAIIEGRVSLSNASTLQMFLKREKKNEKTYTPAQQAGLLAQLENKSTRECEKILTAISPTSAVPQERERVITAESTEIRFVASAELLRKLQKLKSLLSHKVPEQSYSELFELLAERELERLDPEAKERRVKEKQEKAREKEAQEKLTKENPKQQEKLTQEDLKQERSTEPTVQKERYVSASLQLPAPDPVPASASTSAPMSAPRSRYIPALIRRAVWLRDQGMCQHRDPRTGRLCASRYQLELDHLKPFSQGGTHTIQNLKLVCRTHNTWRAIETLGPRVMAPYLRK